MLIEYLIEVADVDEIEKGDPHFKNQSGKNDLAPLHLANCIASEVPINLEVLEKAIIIIIKRKRMINEINLLLRMDVHMPINVFDIIIKGKYSKYYQEVVRKILFHGHYILFVCRIYK